jgi:hypothetical protein
VFSQLNDIFYDQLPKYTNKKSKSDLSTSQQLAVSLSCGVVAGVASAIASHPPDTILSRINMEAKKQIHAGVGIKQETSNWQATKQIVGELGFKGLWKGLGTRCFMVGLLSAGMFGIYDGVKVMCGLPTSSGVGKRTTELALLMYNNLFVTVQNFLVTCKCLILINLACSLLGDHKEL